MNNANRFVYLVGILRHAGLDPASRISGRKARDSGSRIKSGMTADHWLRWPK
jgi:hypothetical protein